MTVDRSAEILEFAIPWDALVSFYFEKKYTK